MYHFIARIDTIWCHDMGRQAKDPALSSLANELSSVVFTEAPDLTDIANERFNSWGSSCESPFRFVGQMPNLKTWVVRLFLGGEKRTIGYTNNLTAACRFADMAQMRFWKYKVRGACEPVHADLNFGVEQAKSDCANETQAIALLDRIEQYLIDKGVINQTRPATNKDFRRTVRHDVLLLHAEVMGALKILADMVKATNTRLDVLLRRGSNCLNAADSDTQRVDNSGPTGSNVGEVKLVPYTVFVPHPTVEGKVSHTVVIEIPVRVENGVEILTPEAHELIDRTRREQIIIGPVNKPVVSKDAFQPAPEPLKEDLNLGVDELFTPPTNTPTQP